MAQSFPPSPIPAHDLAPSMLAFGESLMLPADAYRSAEVFAWERRHFFDGSWVCVGRSSDLPAPRSQKAVAAGAGSVLLTRSDDGQLHAFANLCRHRGHELLPCGGAIERGVVQCPYHAWSYELSGELRVAPHMAEVPNFEASVSGLVPVRHAEWNGWVFVNLSGDAPDFDRHVGALTRLWGNYELGRVRAAASHEYILEANWKLAVENYNECYHCPLIHPELCRVSEPTSGANYTDLSGTWVGGAMTISESAETMSLDGRSHGTMFRGLDDRQRRHVDYVALFPNMLFSLHPDYVMTHRLEPLSASRTRVTCEWLFAPESLDRPGFDPSYAADFWHLTNTQDWAAVESVQRSVASPHYVPGVLAHSEDAIYQWVVMIARGYSGAPLVRGALPVSYER